MHWILKVTHWWNQHCDAVFVAGALFVAGMIVGSCVGFAQ